MDAYPKHIKAQLRTLAQQAHQVELTQLLSELADKFDSWRAGKLDSERLAYLVHHYDTGPFRELWAHYKNAPEASLVAHAIVAGVLNEAEVPVDVLTAIQQPLGFYRHMAADKKAQPRT